MKKVINISAGIFVMALQYMALTASCKKGGDDSAIPILTCPDVSQARTVTDANMRFYLALNTMGKTDASVKYTLVPGSALSPGDFAPASGVVTIVAGQTKGYFDVLIRGDSLRQPDLQFTIRFSDPKNCTLGTASAKGTIVTTEGTFLPTDTAGYSTPLSYPGYTLAWNDEFTSANINRDAWNFEIGGSGWGNHELEYYTDRSQNVFQSDGKLVIEARKESFGGSNYTSARMTTENKKQFKFGRIDIRAKLPVTKGMWPALWMLGSNTSAIGWPSGGETDIMELIGSDPKKIYGTGHFSNTAGDHDSRGGSYSITTGDFSQEFHVFSITWMQDSIKWLVDDHLYFTLTKANAATANYPFNADFYFIINVAVGGDWPGPPDGTTNFPQRMFVDYIRVFQ